MSGSLRLLQAEAPRLKHDHYASCSTPAPSCASTIRAASAACTTHAGSGEHRSLHAGPGAIRRRVQCRLSLAHHARAARRDQTGDDEQTPGDRRRQHLRQRSTVPCAYQSAARGPQRFRSRYSAPHARDAHHAQHRDSRRRHHFARLCGHRRRSRRYFASSLYVYERAGKPAASAGPRSASSTQGQRSSYFCPNCQR